MLSRIKVRLLARLLAAAAVLGALVALAWMAVAGYERRQPLPHVLEWPRLSGARAKIAGTLLDEAGPLSLLIHEDAFPPRFDGRTSASLCQVQRDQDGNFESTLTCRKVHAEVGKHPSIGLAVAGATPLIVTSRWEVRATAQAFEAWSGKETPFEQHASGWQFPGRSEGPRYNAIDLDKGGGIYFPGEMAGLPAWVRQKPITLESLSERVRGAYDVHSTCKTSSGGVVLTERRFDQFAYMTPGTSTYPAESEPAPIRLRFLDGDRWSRPITAQLPPGGRVRSFSCGGGSASLHYLSTLPAASNAANNRSIALERLRCTPAGCEHARTALSGVTQGAVVLHEHAGRLLLIWERADDSTMVKTGEFDSLGSAPARILFPFHPNRDAGADAATSGQLAGFRWTLFQRLVFSSPAAVLLFLKFEQYGDDRSLVGVRIDLDGRATLIERRDVPG